MYPLQNICITAAGIPLKTVAIILLIVCGLIILILPLFIVYLIAQNASKKAHRQAALQSSPENTSNLSASAPVLQLKACSLQSNDLLQLTFSDGSIRTFSLQGLLLYPVYAPLKDQDVIDHFIVQADRLLWEDVNVSIPVSFLYKNSYLL